MVSRTLNSCHDHGMGESISDQWRDGRQRFGEDMGSFHAREAAKYEAKAAELEAAGKLKAAARHRKVAERNRRLAEKHAANQS